MLILIQKLENIVGKGENTGYQPFLLSPQCFKKIHCYGYLNCMEKGQDLRKSLNIDTSCNSQKNAACRRP